MVHREVWLQDAIVFLGPQMHADAHRSETAIQEFRHDNSEQDGLRESRSLRFSRMWDTGVQDRGLVGGIVRA